MIKAIVTDIEGTTSSLSFVKDVLFPYARTHLADFVRSHAHEPVIKALLEETCQLVAEKLDTEQVISQLISWMNEDKKVTPLKSLQGLIWEAGYQQGDFSGHVYADAAEQLKKWYMQGLALYIYSSGSVHAQKLLFAHTVFGDLTPLFSGYFDTHIGGKKDVSSYQRIAEHIGVPAMQILFLSDIAEELDAAKAAGFSTIQLIRDGLFDKQTNHVQVSSFVEIAPTSISG
jgi:enolase-phosphatase E1